MRRTRRLATLVLPFVLAVPGLASAIATLSGMVAANVSGPNADFQHSQVWNTVDAPHSDLFVIEGGLGDPFVNAPDASINILLTNGIHTLTLHGGSTALNSAFGLNLFFDGDQTNPGISVWALRKDTLATDPPFMTTSGSTFTEDVSPIPGAGTLSVVVGSQTITLTDFWWAAPTVHDVDEVGSGQTNPDGNADFVGRVTLVVTPEPGTVGLMGMGLIGLGARRFASARAAAPLISRPAAN